MTLAPFNREHFEQLISWIHSEELNYLWGGPTYSFPLTHEQIATQCNRPEVTPFIFKVSGQSVGYIDVFKIAPGHYRLCRIIISDDFRGQGLSKKMVAAMLTKLRSEFACNIASLAVFGHNIIAKNCYQSLGFNITATDVGARAFNGQPWDLVRMEKPL